MAVPRLEDIARRLQMSRHPAAVEDLLAETPAVVRLSMRPWRGPWTEELSPPEGALELMLDDRPEERVVVRIWLDNAATAPAEEAHVTTAKLGAGWLEQLAADFVARMLSRA